MTEGACSTACSPGKHCMPHITLSNLTLLAALLPTCGVLQDCAAAHARGAHAGAGGRRAALAARGRLRGPYGRRAGDPAPSHAT